MKKYGLQGLVFFLFFILIFWGLGIGVALAKTLYDDFSKSYIDKAKWKDWETDGNPTNEFVREIDTTNEVLVLKLGTQEAIWPVRNALPILNPDTVNSIKADVKIVSINNDPTDTATVFARVGATFYNKNSTNPSDAVGDIWAEICLGNRGNGIEAWIEVTEVIESDAYSKEAYVDLVDNLSLNTFYTLEMSYDGNQTINFSISGPGISSANYTFTDDDNRLALSFTKSKGLQVAVHEDDGEYVNGYIHAEFDNVFINGSGTVYDTFEPFDQGQNRINHNKWARAELVKEPADGHLRLAQRKMGDTVRNRVKLRARHSDYLETKVRIESGSNIVNDVNASANPRGRARINGYIYNQSGNYNGYQDDVWMAVWLQVDKNDNLQARVLLAASNADESVYTVLLSEAFPTTIQFDTDYTLSFSISGNRIEFKCNNDTLVYHIQTPIFEPFNPELNLESRLDIGGDPNSYGYLKARFDDVYVSDPTYTNLSGDWLLNGSNPNFDPPGCGANFNPPQDEPVSLNLNGCEISMTGADIPGGALRGVVCMSKVYLSGMGLEDNGTNALVVESEGDMTSSEEGSAIVNIGGSEDCEVTFDLSMALDTVGSAGDDDSGDSGDGGGGGGCYIKSLTE